MGLGPDALLAAADELAALSDQSDVHAALAVLAAHAALEAFVNQTGAREIASFNLRARFLPKWHDLCQRVVGRQLDSGPDLERLQAIRDRIVGYQGEPERLDRRAKNAAPPVPEGVDAGTARWAVAIARNVMAEFHQSRESRR